MSRIGQLSIPLPPEVTVNIEGNDVAVKGPKGELCRRFHPDLSISLKDGNLVVKRPNNERVYRALHGLTRSLLANMVEGVTKGFERSLELVGVGFRAQKVGEKLILQVGYSHPVEFSPPPGISLLIEGANRLRVTGIDKELVGKVATEIRAICPPDSYKGKGIRYVGEKVRLKPGKAMTKKK